MTIGGSADVPIADAGVDVGLRIYLRGRLLGAKSRRVNDEIDEINEINENENTLEIQGRASQDVADKDKNSVCTTSSRSSVPVCPVRTQVRRSYTQHGAQQGTSYSQEEPLKLQFGSSCAVCLPSTLSVSSTCTM
jgi:hypothetical protein